MATVSSMPPMLRLERSTQSGTLALAAAWAVLYTESCVMAYLFCGAEIDLSNMQAGDIVDIRIRKQVVAGGGWVNHNQVQYLDAQPAAHPAIHINPIPDVYGVEISAQQTAGVLRNIDAEFYDAKRLGLS